MEQQHSGLVRSYIETDADIIREFATDLRLKRKLEKSGGNRDMDSLKRIRKRLDFDDEYEVPYAAISHSEEKEINYDSDETYYIGEVDDESTSLSSTLKKSAADELREKVYLTEFKKQVCDPRKLEQDTIFKSKSPLWVHFHQRMLMASMFGMLCKQRKSSSASKIQDQCPRSTRARLLSIAS